MFETNVTVVGVTVSPPWRLRSERTGATGAKLRLMSTSRRFDRTQGKWVDGDRLFVEVVCWRDLADHVCESVFKGDPLIVAGRLYTRDFETDGKRRWAYEIDATSVGHDMARGVSRFARPQPAGWVAEVVDPIAGETAAAGPSSTDIEVAGNTTPPRQLVPASGSTDAVRPAREVDQPASPADREPITPPAAFAA